ncbi:hypothetical protein MMC27_001811 [Xylographa pallens]|nr:hypothetical protein [Xylographa pallens]
MPFRLEYAPSGRAGCKATECKKQGIKIDKGELRHGTFLEIQEHQSWAWKHWGCVTPVQIANLNKEIEGNLEYLDGYEDLNDDDKAKVRQALADGHVSDEDWRYDIEMNRPGKKGFRSPAYKAQQKADKKASRDEAFPTAAEEQDANATPPKLSPKKRSLIKVEVDGEEDGAAEPVAKRKRARVKKESNTEVEAHNAAEAAPQTSRSRSEKKMIHEANYGTGGQEELKKPRAVSTKIKEEAATGDGPIFEISVPRKAKLQTKKPAAKMKREVFEDHEDISENEVSDEAMLPGKSTSNDKKSAQKVKPEVVGKEGIENDMQESTAANQAVKAKSGRKKKMTGIGGPYMTVETSNATVRAANILIESDQLIWGSGSQAQHFDQSYSFQN